LVAAVVLPLQRAAAVLLADMDKDKVKVSPTLPLFNLVSLGLSGLVE
jgi:hypothetical protein